jgi:drug/metabolite transporter (DMT)-like permease
MKAPKSYAPVAAALLATLCWGAGTTLTKLALFHFEPSLLLVIQLLASIVFLACMAPLLGVRLPRSGSVSKLCWLGILEPGLAYFLGLEGLARISAAEAVVLSSTESILVVALAWLFAVERPRGIVLVLALIGCAGAVLVAGSHWNLGGLAPSLLGDLLLLSGVLCAAGYVVWSARLAAVTEPISALLAQQTVAVLVAIVMHLVVSTQPLALNTVAAAGWILAVASGIVQYACAFWLYLWALKGLRASVAGLYLSLIPVSGLVVAIPVLGERLTIIQWMGALLIIGSIVVLTRVREEAHEAELPAAGSAPASVR